MVNTSSTSDSVSKVTSAMNLAGPGGNGPDLPYFPHLSITGHKLNGKNYLQWSQSVLMYVRGKGKADYLLIDAATPEEKDSGYKTWMTENNMIMSWLVNSMTTEIGENFLMYSTAKEIWDAAKETYSNKDNSSELVAIEGILHDLRQGDSTVTQYFNVLHKNWQQLDVFEKYNWADPKDAALYKKIIEQKRVFKFLLGLNNDLDEVRGRILGMKPIPGLREAFSEVRREESRKKLMLGPKTDAPFGSATEASAFAVKYTQFSTQRRNGRPWCDHCRRPGHTKETCWKIHGKPADWKPKNTTAEKESRGNMATNADSGVSLSREELDALRKLLQQPQTSVIGSGSLAQSGFEFGDDDWQC